MAPRKHSQTRRPNGVKELPVRSARISDEVWEKARIRANYEGITMSNVMSLFVEGYSTGALNLPRITVMYVQPARDEVSV